MSLKEVRGEIKVPHNTGIEGFIHVLRSLLKKPRIQRVEIDAKGIITFSRFKLVDEDTEEEEQPNFGTDFTSLQPYNIVRNSRVRELQIPDDMTAAVAVGYMFDQAAYDQFTPTAFVLGRASLLWDWYYLTTGHAVRDRKNFFGLPVRTDRPIPDSALLLCAARGNDASFIDTQTTYKVTIPLEEEA